MKTNVAMPRVGSSDDTDEVKILRWLKNVGDSIQEGDGLAGGRDRQSNRRN